MENFIYTLTLCLISFIAGIILGCSIREKIHFHLRDRHGKWIVMIIVSAVWVYTVWYTTKNIEFTPPIHVHLLMGTIVAFFFTSNKHSDEK